MFSNKALDFSSGSPPLHWMSTRCSSMWARQRTHQTLHKHLYICGCIHCRAGDRDVQLLVKGGWMNCRGRACSRKVGGGPLPESHRGSSTLLQQTGQGPPGSQQPAQRPCPLPCSGCSHAAAADGKGVSSPSHRGAGGLGVLPAPHAAAGPSERICGHLWSDLPEHGPTPATHCSGCSR